MISTVVALVHVWAPTAAIARTEMVYGGSALTSYVYAGKQEDNIFAEGEDNAHDLRIEAGALFGLAHERARHELELGLFAGGIVAARFNAYRHALVRLNVNDTLLLTRRFQLSSSLSGDLGPVSATQANATARADTVGRLAMTLGPELEGRLAVSRRHEARLGLRANTYALLASDLEDQEVASAIGVQTDASWSFQWTRVHGISFEAVGRVMRSGVQSQSAPTTVLLGGLLGYALHWTDRFELTARAGIGRVLNFDRSYLLPVEPLIHITAGWQSRTDEVQAELGWTVEESQFAAGLPQRTVRALIGYQRLPTWQRWRWLTSIGYEHVRTSADPQLGAESLPADDVHAIRAQGRLLYTVFGHWCLVSEATVTAGLASLARPQTCGATGTESCPDRGVHVTLTTGVAYLFARRPQDERLVQHVR